MALTVSPTVSQVITDIIVVIASIVPAGTPIVRGKVNRVPAPPPNPGYVVLTELFSDPLEWPSENWGTDEEPTTLTYTAPSRLEVQCDVYGPSAGEWAGAIARLWHTPYAGSLMANSQPLGMPQARQIPLLDSELQLETRWTMTLSAQQNLTMSPAQTFADDLSASLEDVEVAFPPEPA